jgi:hypothetical protein
MKEIDFLPEWYKSGRRRQVSYCTQYLALSGVFVVMMVWSIFAKHAISKAKIQFAQAQTEQAQAENVSAKLAELKSELRGLQKKTESIEKIGSKIDVANVLAELSFLIDEKIVLSKVEFVAEKFVDKQQAKPSGRAGAVVRVARAKLDDKRELPLSDVRFKVVVAGVAADASDVGALICKLDDSPYFCQVVPSFSRNAKINVESAHSVSSQTKMQERTLKTKRTVREAGENIQVQVSEFEINCYLANYRQQ